MCERDGTNELKSIYWLAMLMDEMTALWVMAALWVIVYPFIDFDWTCGIVRKINKILPLIFNTSITWNSNKTSEILCVCTSSFRKIHMKNMTTYHKNQLTNVINICDNLLLLSLSLLSQSFISKLSLWFRMRVFVKKKNCWNTNWLQLNAIISHCKRFWAAHDIIQIRKKHTHRNNS